MLWLVVDADGLPQKIRVQRSLGMGLDEVAVNAVKQWRFQPAKKDGKPVQVMINVEVNFKLVLAPPLLSQDHPPTIPGVDDPYVSADPAGFFKLPGDACGSRQGAGSKTLLQVGSARLRGMYSDRVLSRKVDRQNNTSISGLDGQPDEWETLAYTIGDIDFQ